jgi:hypothetical protein
VCLPQTQLRNNCIQFRSYACMQLVAAIDPSDIVKPVVIHFGAAPYEFIVYSVLVYTACVPECSLAASSYWLHSCTRQPCQRIDLPLQSPDLHLNLIASLFG